jgi:hypothetical protein
MERRDLLRALASATALIVLPNDKALAAWSRVAAGSVAPNGGLTGAQMALVRAVADTLIPRTDTPSATDVGVHRFVDVIVSEQLSDEERAAGLAGLDAVNARAMSESNVVFADLSAEAKGKFIESLESGARDADPAKTYWRLKGLIVHGYFTSEPVMKDVLKYQVMPGKFEGAAPVTIKKRPSTTLTPPSDGAEAHVHG